jgi:hypothetical protein
MPIARYCAASETGVGKPCRVRNVARPTSASLATGSIDSASTTVQRKVTVSGPGPRAGIPPLPFVCPPGPVGPTPSSGNDSSPSLADQASGWRAVMRNENSVRRGSVTHVPVQVKLPWIHDPSPPTHSGSMRS